METLTSLSAKIFSKNHSNRALPDSNVLLGRADICISRSLSFSVPFYRSLSLQDRPIRVVASSHMAFDPEVLRGLGNAESQNDKQTIKPWKTMHVKFQLQKQCLFGEQFLLVGSDPMIGSWDPSNAIPLNWSDGHIWNVEIDVPVGLSIQFKLLLKQSTGDLLWQPGPDRIFQAWESENAITIVEDWENAELQKIVEGQMTDQVAEQGLNPNLNQVVAGDLTPLTGEFMLNMNKDIMFSDSSPMAEEEQIMNSTHEFTMKDGVGSKEDKPVSQTDVRTLPSKNQRIGEDEEAFFTHEEGHVLVPGLTTLPLVSTEGSSS